MCNGEFLQKDPNEAIEYLNELAEKAHIWTRPSATESTNTSRPTGNPNGGRIYHFREEDNLKAKVIQENKEIKSHVSKLMSSLSVNERGRSFLATANALINYRNGLKKLSFANMTMDVNIFHISKQPREDDECQQTYMINALIDKEVHTTHDFDPLEYFLVNYEFDTISDSSDDDICAICYETQD
ncbi:hypothetical protein F2P56_030332 [Juglans regia]|uniref:Uncharacterized protein n=2 Tax=Juglans regia TaxID=51240 RepID=A0A833WZB5_JUGRE|nr:uncharacterized protein LOC109019342 [Juglans regia]KAF5449936.1 hypothetical protein F2P56_030332 [Juglans regia]